VNTTLGTLVVGGPDGDIVLGASGTGSTGNFGAISGSGLDITGNANIGGNLTLGGKLTIGDATSDTVNVVASLSSSLIPSVTNAFDLGSENYFWRDIYVSTGSIKFVGAAGNVVGTLTNVGNGLNLDGGIVTNGNSSFGTSSLSTTTVSGSLLVNGNVRVTNGGITGSIAATNGVVSGSSQVTLSGTTGFDTFSGSIDSAIIASVPTWENLNGKPAGIVSGSSQITSLNNSFSGLQTFNNINVNGTASFAYIQSTTGSSTSIGESFIVLNENTPASNFAGIKVVDSGSTFATSSFVYDGLNNNWVFQKANTGSSDTSVAIFGPISTNGLGTELGLTQNKLPKAVSSHGHHIGDSNITDNGSVIVLGSNSVVSGSLIVTGSIVGSGLTTTGIVKFEKDILIGSSTEDWQKITVGFGPGILSQHLATNLAVGTSNLASLEPDFATSKGVFNTAVGNSILTFVTTGSFNTVVGGQAGTSMEAGVTHNTAIGYRAGSHNGGNSNTYIGALAGSEGNRSSANIGIGYVALSSDTLNASSEHNIGIGMVAGNYLSGSSSNNIIIGREAGPQSATDESNKLYIGHAGYPLLTGSLAEGALSLTINGATQVSGAVKATSFSGEILANNGVLSGSLVAQLPSGTISGSSQVIGILSSLNTYTGSNDTTNTTQNSRLDQLSTASGSAISRLSALEVETANLETFSGSALTRLTTLEVETSNLETFTASMSTTSNVRFGSLGIGMAASGTSGRIDATNDIVAFSSSDIRFKENITPIENALDKISKISGNTYDWKAENKIEHGYEGNDVGVIAQEIEAVLPQLVQTRENGFKAVKYDKLVALLIQGIKEQQLQIEELKAKIGL
jgi:hypothetical protein